MLGKSVYIEIFIFFLKWGRIYIILEIFKFKYEEGEAMDWKEDHQILILERYKYLLGLVTAIEIITIIRLVTNKCILCLIILMY
jgi:hypothetical protein